MSDSDVRSVNDGFIRVCPTCLYRDPNQFRGSPEVIKASTFTIPTTNWETRLLPLCICSSHSAFRVLPSFLHAQSIHQLASSSQSHLVAPRVYSRQIDIGRWCAFPSNLNIHLIALASPPHSGLQFQNIPVESCDGANSGSVVLGRRPLMISVKWLSHPTS